MNEWKCLGCLKSCLSSEGGGEQLEGNLFQVDSHAEINLMWVNGRKQTPTWKSKTVSKMSQKKSGSIYSHAYPLKGGKMWEGEIKPATLLWKLFLYGIFNLNNSHSETVEITHKTLKNLLSVRIVFIHLGYFCVISWIGCKLVSSTVVEWCVCTTAGKRREGLILPD